MNEIESEIHSNKISPSEKNHILDFNPRPYHNFDIKPTQTFEGSTENAEFTRMAKNLDDNSFLLKRDPRLNISGSPITPTATVSPQDQVQVTATVSPGVTNNARQNTNPDIQDIITGIVKLLNGNVNVHANTQLPQRRPVATRINNRGPPRISESQPIPVEYEGGRPSSNNRPPAYPYDRHDRPYITGVPIPEQVVPPTFQQNFRPGFVSQNSNTKRPPPPWHTNRRQPITGSGRRPIPQYKPLPPAGEHHSEEGLQSTTVETENSESGDAQSAPTLNSFETDFPSDRDGATGNGVSNGYIGVGEDDDDDSEELESLQPDKPLTKDKEDLQTKKKIHKPNKTTEKSGDPPLPDLSAINPLSEMHLHTSEDEDISFFIATTSKTLSTPSLDTVSSSSAIAVSTTEKVSPTTSSSSSQPPPTTSSVVPPSVTPAAPDQPYHPRPGIVLDDPEFKPGGQARPVRPYQNIQPTRPHLPPGYGEIFDVTLSAIQGPGGGPATNNKQTINITPYGIETSTGTGDVIIAPTEDDEFVSIDGKRTYINLFGEATQGPTPQTEIVPVNDLSQQQVIGTGYAVPEVDISPTASQKPIVLPTNLQQQQRPHYRPRTTQPPVRIDTCIVGDDSTCDQAQNERCRTENGVSSCHCRPGYSRRKHREPCRRVVSFFLGLRVDKIYEHKIVWSKQLLDSDSEQYGKLSYESIRAVSLICDFVYSN